MTNNENTNTELKCEILPEDLTECDLSFKLIVIGDAGVGKSCLTTKATKDIFIINYNITMGFEFFSMNLKLNDVKVKLQIWDTCGQELYKSLVSNFYKNCSLAIMVYAINNKTSFVNVESWLKDLRFNSKPDAKVFLIGNKIDLENEREVSKEEGEKYANENKFGLFMETSAKSGINVKEIFIEAAKVLYNDFLLYKDKEGESDWEEFYQMVSRKNSQVLSNKSKKMDKSECNC